MNLGGNIFYFVVAPKQKKAAFALTYAFSFRIHLAKSTSIESIGPAAAAAIPAGEHFCVIGHVRSCMDSNSSPSRAACAMHQ